MRNNSITKYPDFSVLLSLYAKESPEYFYKAMSSVFANSIMPSEVVLILDGPIGNTLKKHVSYFQSLYDNLKIVELKRNMGLAEALNIGLKHCSFDFVARMDTDDICLPNRFELQISYLKNNPDIDIVGSTAIQIDEKGEKIGLWNVPLSHNDITNKIWACPFVHPSVMFKKSSILRVGSYNIDAGPRQDDYELWIRSAINGLKFANIEEPLILYRFFADNLKRNSVKVGWYTFKNGMKACRHFHLPFRAYLGIVYPLFRSLLPYPFNKWVNEFMMRFNPRNKV